MFKKENTIHIINNNYYIYTNAQPIFCMNNQTINLDSSYLTLVDPSLLMLIIIIFGSNFHLNMQ